MALLCMCRLELAWRNAEAAPAQEVDDGAAIGFLAWVKSRY
jgi:hypothetical protein